MRYYPDPAKNIDLKSLNHTVEEAFREHGKNQVTMPPKEYVDLPKGDFRTMPAYIPSMNIAGVKIVNVHPENVSFGLPTVMALTVILDTETGRPVAVINATHLTDLRTAAAGAVAAKYLSGKKSIRLGLVGSGNQAKASVMAISKELDVEEVYVWSRNEMHASSLCSFLKNKGFECRSVSVLQKACDCDVLVTATPSRAPLVREEWINEGTHINAVGADAPGKEELDPGILKKASVYVDDVRQAVHSGEINVPLSKGFFSESEISGTLGEVVLGKKKRNSGSGITVFDSTGLAIQDLAIAKTVMDGPDIYTDLDFAV
ncbi:alanine dehydrogenase [Methanomicrobium sp. W14]|uniref:ornithine cyclodeaminase family protein n=1 Tax=Methanomicrobium sp. W14 TaxID=2817839 RepID=UPI001AE77F71|nr:ornithine cyclodeaminase family protein [Methanomicrobium sp. W14]MBP2134348.1 alanine dehydrogenase [Methanomicrobium sp. W14]